MRGTRQAKEPCITPHFPPPVERCTHTRDRGSVDGSDFKAQKIPFTRDNQYMIAAYNYSLAEIEERLFCRVCAY
jgi:hypothetical protein